MSDSDHPQQEGLAAVLGIDLKELSGEDALPFAMAGEVMYRAFKWIMHGSVTQRSLRMHLVVLCISPHVLPCKKPSSSWCAKIHGVSRQWAHRLLQEFTHELGLDVRYRGRQFFVS